MIKMQRGFRAKLDDMVDTGQTVSVEIAITGKDEYDFSCFGLDGNDRLSDDSYFIFFNQLQSPANEIILSRNNNIAVFSVNLRSLPDSIQKLAFTVNIDGKGIMSTITSCSAKINQNGYAAFQLDLTGGDFKKQKAIIMIEIYKKNGWRIHAVANGFDGGLDKLVPHYGGEVTLDPDGGSSGASASLAPRPAPPQPTPSPPSADAPPAPPRSEAEPQRRAPAPPATSTPRPVPGDDDYFEPQESDWI